MTALLPHVGDCRTADERTLDAAAGLHRLLEMLDVDLEYEPVIVDAVGHGDSWVDLPPDTAVVFVRRDQHEHVLTDTHVATIEELHGVTIDRSLSGSGILIYPTVRPAGPF